MILGMDDSGLRCLRCDYNLTGLNSESCPECGSPLDWELLRNDLELRRQGTPAYRVRGLRVVPATIASAALLVFTPWSFARRVRVDEPLFPPIAVFVTCVTLYSYWVFGLVRTSRLWPLAGIFLAMTAAMVIAQALVFASLSSAGDSKMFTWHRRFRTWAAVGLYSSVFIPAWPWFGAGIWALEMHEFTTMWPFYPYRHAEEVAAVSVFLVWWFAVLAVFLVKRNHPRWLALLNVPLAYLAVRCMVQVIDMSILRLSR